MRIFFRVVLGVVIVVALAVIGFVIWAEQPSIAAISPPARSTFDKATIARGATLVAMGNCAECHTSPGGKPLAGGYPVPTPFGTVYGTNITPDPQTGIGSWSEAAFARAMRQGIRRDGAHLYPAFPYTHFTKVTDADIKAIYAYLMTRPAVHHAVPAPQLPFPLDIRLVMAGWNLFFFEPGRFAPADGKSKAWNQGAYIAEGLGHCGACHSPHNWFGAEDRQNRYAGGNAEGWHAPALDGKSPAPVPWTEAQLATYLRAGFASDHGVAAGPMAGVARALQKVPTPDVTALATYIASFEPQTPGRTAKATNVAAAATTGNLAFQIATAQSMHLKGTAQTGKAIFASACASCHFAGGRQPFYRPVRLKWSSVVAAPTARNFVQVVVNGIQPPPGQRGHWMPPFGNALTNQQIIKLAQYVRSHFSGKP
ncbi:MAG TPA: cytochrome c, partial [Pseudolabrys sp.]|nr:cytochrome c [Pseudolabrys sp.]